MTTLSDNEIVKMIFNHHNQYRNQHKLKSLQCESSLINSALLHSKEMSQKGQLYHNMTDGVKLQNVILCTSNWLKEEHIHKITKKWYEHPPHQRTILETSVTKIGIGWYYKDLTKKEIFMTCNFS